MASPALPASSVKKVAEVAESTPEELQARMQNMIDLQYAAASRDAETTMTTTNLFDMNVVAHESSSSGGAAAPPRNVMGTSVLPYKAPPSLPAPPPAPAASSSERPVAMYGSSDDSLVGRGQLLFPSDYPKAPPPPDTNPMLPTTTTTLYANYGGTTEAPPQHLESLTPENDPAADYDEPSDLMDPPSSVSHRQEQGCGCRMWLCSCTDSMLEAESLHRSFCYGAIDGMLTGSGIVSAFLGMGVLTNLSSLATRWFVVGFCFSACTSDAICVAVGHVWNTYVMTLASAAERRTERVAFEQHRGDCKGKLVDMLLSRGMLKIDAMSIADTLEGYPDIFVSALVGDSGYALGDEPLKPTNVALGTRPYRSYGSFSEWEYDPEAALVAQTMNESRTEGFIMMTSFAMFSVLPALTHLVVSEILQEPTSTAVSDRSLTMSVISFIMVLLGIWKSTFFDSNWIMFGIETVLVLFICVTSAYVLGAVLSSALPSNCLFGMVSPKNGSCQMTDGQ